MFHAIIKPYLNYNEDEILALYRAVGWTNYVEQKEMLKSAFAHSLFVAGAYKEDELVGLIRVLGDGHSLIYIQDLLVMPSLQRQGLGKQLLSFVLERYKEVYQKVLLTDSDEGLIAFYRSSDFVPVAELNCVSFKHHPRKGS